MQNSFKSALGSVFLKTGTLFRRQQWKEYFIFLFFLLLSFGFWLLQSLQQDYERRIELPLRYKNVPQEWALSENNPKNISILLKDKGTTLLYYSWNSNFIPVDINVSALSRLTEYSLNISRNVLETAVSKQLISSTSIISIEPREIEIYYDSLSSRIVPVVENISITTTPGFQISDSIKLSTSEVRIYGSRKALDSLNVVRTKLITLDGVSKTKEVTAHLDLPKGVNADNETVKLTIPVDEFTEKKLQLQVLCPDIPVGYELRIFPSTVEVTCNVPLKYFKDLTDEKLGIVIPFNEFEINQSTGKIQVRLTEKPSWVISYAVVPDQLEFIIEYLKND
jgi:Uncharacterized protein conserved in bacteria